MTSTSRGNRTDPHRPGSIVPAEYTYVMSYALPTMAGGFVPVPGFRYDCVLDHAHERNGKTIMGEHDGSGRCCARAHRNSGALYAELGGIANCTICGARYGMGDIWLHVPSGEHIHLGHTCADKYEMLADRSQVELEMGRRKAAAAVQVKKTLNTEEREAFLAKHDGLAEDLVVDHRIINEIAGRFQQYRTLSEKQIALVRKLADEVRNPKPEEKHVPAPEGRVEVEGLVVSVKSYDSDYGVTVKMVVKVATPDGSWLVYVTVPSGLSGDSADGLKGCTVRFSATLKRGRDAHFALGKRPTKASIVNDPGTARVAQREVERKAAADKLVAEAAATAFHMQACDEVIAKVVAGEVEKGEAAAAWLETRKGELMAKWLSGGAS